MPFFEPLPPLPEPREEEPTGWRPPSWDRPSEACIGAPVPIVALLAKTDVVALVFSNVEAYPNGFTFELLIQRNPMAPRHANDHRPFMFMGPSPVRRGPRIGLEFANGERVVEGSPMPIAGGAVMTFSSDSERDDRGVPTRAILRSQGGGGGHDRFTMRFWCFPLPPAGPARVYVEWTDADIAETDVTIDAALIVESASDAIVLWEPEPEA